MSLIENAMWRAVLPSSGGGMEGGLPREEGQRLCVDRGWLLICGTHSKSRCPGRSCARE
jgi:hypothetical protein